MSFLEDSKENCDSFLCMLFINIQISSPRETQPHSKKRMVKHMGKAQTIAFHTLAEHAASQLLSRKLNMPSISI